MSYKYLLIGLGTGVLFLLLIIFGMTGGLEAKSNKIDNDNLATTKADKVEIFYFHTSQRCVTCLTIGRLSKETVNEFFQPELKNGQVEFREINIDLSENKALANKFQASGSSLFLNAISNGRDNIVEDVNVWRLTQNETSFKNYLKSKIDNLLGR